MREFISNLTERNFSNKTVGLIENGSWAPMAAKVMREALSKCKNITFCENSVKITSALNKESEEQLNNLAFELI
jgi:flavorubredoxin